MGSFSNYTFSTRRLLPTGIVILVVIVGAVLLLTSNGSNGRHTGKVTTVSPPLTQQASIKITMKTYIVALSDRNYELACGEMTPALWQQVVTAAQTKLRETRGVTHKSPSRAPRTGVAACSTALPLLVKPVKGLLGLEIPFVDQGVVEVTGNTATLSMNGRTFHFSQNVTHPNNWMLSSPYLLVP